MEHIRRVEYRHHRATTEDRSGGERKSRYPTGAEFNRACARQRVHRDVPERRQPAVHRDLERAGQRDAAHRESGADRFRVDQQRQYKRQQQRGKLGADPETDVTNLVSDLGQRPTKGAAFGANGVAVVDNNGILETAVGQVGDCVMVDGTTGPCGAPTFADAETPGGVLDGVNTTFTLANAPSGTSLMLFRNGIYQTTGYDYTLTGSTIQFATGAVPQPGDTLTASYRVDPAAAGAVAQVAGSGPVVRSTTAAQVICNATGIGTRIGTWTTLGSCDVPASQLQSGDRIELRFSFTHVGHLVGFDLQVNWGATTILARHGGAQDAAVVGIADAAITSTGALITVESWGTVLQFLPGVLSAPAQNGVTISLSASAGTSTTDSVQLTNFTVLRYPAN